MDLYNLVVSAKISKGGGGGNPNTVQTVTGTLSNPFGTVDYDELKTALKDKGASVLFEADASALGAGYVKAWLSSAEYVGIYCNGANFGEDLQGPVSAFVLSWDKTLGLTGAKMSNGNTITDIKGYASLIPTTLTIIWHPLP